MARMPSRKENSVSRPCLRCRMPVLRVAEHRAAFCQPPHAALVDRREPGQIVETHLVDRQDQNEFRPRCRRLAPQRRKPDERNHRGCQESCSFVHGGETPQMLMAAPILDERARPNRFRGTRSSHRPSRGLPAFGASLRNRAVRRASAHIVAGGTPALASTLADERLECDCGHHLGHALNQLRQRWKGGLADELMTAVVEQRAGGPVADPMG